MKRALADGIEHHSVPGIVIRCCCRDWSFARCGHFNGQLLFSASSPQRAGWQAGRTLTLPPSSRKRGSVFPRNRSMAGDLTTCPQQGLRPGQPHCGRWEETGLGPAQERRGLHLATKENKLAEQVLTVLHIWTLSLFFDLISFYPSVCPL